MNQKFRQLMERQISFYLERAQFWADASKDKKLKYETRMEYWQWSLKRECEAERLREKLNYFLSR